VENGGLGKRQVKAGGVNLKGASGKEGESGDKREAGKTVDEGELPGAGGEVWIHGAGSG